MTNSLPWKDPPIFKFGQPSISIRATHHHMNPTQKIQWKNLWFWDVQRTAGSLSTMLSGCWACCFWGPRKSHHGCSGLESSRSRRKKAMFGVRPIFRQPHCYPFLPEICYHLMIWFPQSPGSKEPARSWEYQSLRPTQRWPQRWTPLPPGAMPHPVPGGFPLLCCLGTLESPWSGTNKSMHEISKPDFSRPRCAGEQTSPGLASAKWQSDESSSCLRSGSGLLGPSSNGTEILQDCPSKINRSNTKAVVCLGKIEYDQGESHINPTLIVQIPILMS